MSPLNFSNTEIKTTPKNKKQKQKKQQQKRKDRQTLKSKP
jgi:hypothetical protein